MYGQKQFSLLIPWPNMQKTGQTHVHKYLDILMQKIVNNEIDQSFVITYRGKLDDAPELYKTFRDKKDGCIKVVMKP